ncbi:MAG: zinc ribbon domain-containing protein, partial [Parcubacteria group bacterium]|nr:zinc ribbon domain-containing protein [Parcubacteria group bacterium]
LGAVDYLVKDNTTLDIIAEKISQYVGRAPARKAPVKALTGERAPERKQPSVEKSRPAQAAAVTSALQLHNFCSSCGYKLKKSDKFCPNCGSPQ